jgi:hypothetical protein
MGMEKGTIIQKWINVDKLPHDVCGNIDWVHSVGIDIEFQYGQINSYLRILQYEHKKSSVIIYIDGYTDLVGKRISVDSLRGCRLGYILKRPIYDTNPELIKYLVNIEDAYRYPSHSGIKVKTRCPICGAEKYKQIGKLTNRGFSCNICSDGLSYPNKFMYNILKQLGIKFQNEISKMTTGFNWITNGCRYDFYFETSNNKYFLEMDGAFHYKNIFLNSYDQQQIDKFKDIIAIEHHIDMIRINCDYPELTSRFQFIKNQILNSELYNLFDLSVVDWNMANRYAINSMVVKVANLWNDGNKSTKEIATITNISTSTVVSYLKIGNEIGLCEYTEKVAEENRKHLAIKSTAKPLALFRNNIQIGVFQSASELERMSEDLYGKRIMKGHASEVCRGDRQQTCGFTMKYITQEEYEQLILQFN